mmetsp:Transcript_34617/g.83558  ORF Transcript_34617/g.83558 Transcript_34617/m.83558 type:complete len:202 (-) Transcript_34617:57-662(-)
MGAGKQAFRVYLFNLVARCNGQTGATGWYVGVGWSGDPSCFQRRMETDLDGIEWRPEVIASIVVGVGALVVQASADVHPGRDRCCFGFESYPKHWPYDQDTFPTQPVHRGFAERGYVQQCQRPFPHPIRRWDFHGGSVPAARWGASGDLQRRRNASQAWQKEKGCHCGRPGELWQWTGSVDICPGQGICSSELLRAAVCYR